MNKGDARKALDSAQKKMSGHLLGALCGPHDHGAHQLHGLRSKDRCDVWAPTQGQSVARMVASQVSGLPPDKVFIHTPLLGCGLGREATPTS